MLLRLQGKLIANAKRTDGKSRLLMVSRVKRVGSEKRVSTGIVECSTSRLRVFALVFRFVILNHIFIYLNLQNDFFVLLCNEYVFFKMYI